LNLGESWTHAKAKCPKCNAVVDVPPAAEIPMPKPPQDKPQAVPVSRHPTATKAPVPTGTKSYRKLIVAAIAASFTVGLLFGCCAASVVFWMFPRAQGVLPEGVKGAVDKAAGNPKDDMTWQELEDRLNAAGWKVHRTPSKHFDVMWYGERLPARQFVEAYEDKSAGGPWLAPLYDDGNVRVTKFSGAEAAKLAVARTKDIYQDYTLAWGPFVFDGRKAVLDDVKKRLEK